MEMKMTQASIYKKRDEEIAAAYDTYVPTKNTVTNRKGFINTVGESNPERVVFEDGYYGFNIYSRPNLEDTLFVGIITGANGLDDHITFESDDFNEVLEFCRSAIGISELTPEENALHLSTFERLVQESIATRKPVKRAPVKKAVTFTVRTTAPIKDHFLAACDRKGETPSDVIRRLMREYTAASWRDQP